MTLHETNHAHHKTNMEACNATTHDPKKCWSDNHGPNHANTRRNTHREGSFRSPGNGCPNSPRTTPVHRRLRPPMDTTRRQLDTAQRVSQARSIFNPNALSGCRAREEWGVDIGLTSPPSAQVGDPASDTQSAGSAYG
jgi:hypothetical protein